MANIAAMGMLTLGLLALTVFFGVSAPASRLAQTASTLPNWSIMLAIVVQSVAGGFWAGSVHSNLKEVNRRLDRIDSALEGE